MIFTRNASQITYPPLLWKFPALSLIMHLWNYLLYIRNAYVLREAVVHLRKAPHSTVLDVGAGEGQHIVPLALLFRQARLIGIDIQEAGHALRQMTARHLQLPHLASELLDIEKKPYQPPVDLIVCTGVLQYLRDDKAALQHLHSSLVPGGKLIMWVPVHNHYLLPYFRKWHQGKNNYENIAQRQRIYSSESLAQKLAIPGFTEVQRHSKMGFFGILAYELVSTLNLAALRSPNLLTTALISALILLLLPLSTLLYALEALGIRLGYCNAQLIIATK